MKRSVMWRSKQPFALLAAAIIVGVIGAFLLTQSHAATAYVSSEPENGSTGAPATVVTDATASGGKAITFGPVSGTKVETYGAVGDGVTDDTVALKKALSTAPAGSTLVFSAGKTYKFSDILSLTVAGLHLTGGGTLLAANYADSAVHVMAANVTIDGGLLFKFNTAGQSRQSAGWNTMIWIDGVSGAHISNIMVDGSPSAGILMFGASNYTIDHVTVQNTLADSIHSTYGSYNGTITNCTTINSGDDGYANVSYIGDGAQVHNITYANDTNKNQAYARGFSVVGGHDITFTNITSDASSAAALYIAAEPSFNTYGVSNVKVNGATFSNSVTNPTVGHGAVMIYNGQPGQTVSNVDLENITVINTKNLKMSQVDIISGGSGGVSGLQFRNFTITGGTSSVFSTQSGAGDYNTLNWNYNGTRLADHQGFTPFP